MKNLCSNKILIYLFMLIPMVGCNENEKISELEQKIENIDTKNQDVIVAPPLFHSHPIEIGGSCANGGLQLDMGNDLNLDNQLQPDEISKTQFICHGQNGVDGKHGKKGETGEQGTKGHDGRNALSSYKELSPGNRCSTGGYEIHLGLDDNFNNVLDQKEIDHVEILCNGVNGFSALQTSTQETSGANCQQGGVKIQTGLDDGAGDGVAYDLILHTDEVDHTQYLCHGSQGQAGINGFNALTDRVIEPSGTHCAEGGVKLIYGLDNGQGNGIANDYQLHADEIIQSTYVCHGDTGETGFSTLTATLPEPPGTNCVFGGIQINIGIDDGFGHGNAHDGLLHPDEIDQIQYLCHGENGFNPLISTTQEPSGINCPMGGYRIDSGLDNGDGAGIAYDGQLSSSEVDQSVYVCHGSNGTAGLNGYSALNITQAESPGTNCPAGGYRIDVGLDNGDGLGIAYDNVLHGDEIDSSQYLCHGTSSSAPGNTITALFITDMKPNFGFSETPVTLQVSGLRSKELTIRLGKQNITPDFVSDDLSQVVFTVPDEAKSDGLYIQNDDIRSNTMWFTVSETGVISPEEEDVFVDSDGNRIAISYILVALDRDSDTRAEADRLATLVRGEVVGRIALLNTWQITVDAESLDELQAIAEELELNSSVDFTFFDMEIENDAINWSGDPERGEQRDRNRVEEGAALYEAEVDPLAVDKVRPFFMSIGVSELGVDFAHPDFSEYGESGTSASGNVSVYSPQKEYKHGTNVTGVIAAELGDLGNAGVIRALSASHGGANISVGTNEGIWGAGRLSKTEQQLQAGASVINWSWGLHRKRTLQCNGTVITNNLASTDQFNAYNRVISRFFLNLSIQHPSAVIVSSAGNGASDAGSMTNRLPTSIVSDQLIVVGAHTSGGTENSIQTEDDAAANSCFDNAINVRVKRAGYSNYGQRVDIAASGSIMGLANSAHAPGNRGTSYAAPMVTATVALMQSINPNLTPLQIKTFLRTSALPIENKVTTTGVDAVFTRPLSSDESISHEGQGARLNVEGAVQAALDSLSVDNNRLVDPVDVRISAGVDEVTQSIELTIPDSDVFDKVDIMFLVDVSGSYRDDISTFRTKADELIDAFGAAGTNVHIGLASFSDFPLFPFGTPVDYAYQLNQPLSADFELVKDALNELTILNGSDGPESQLEALFMTTQSDTGWRAGALPVIFLATDASFHNSDDESSYPGRGYTETLNQLKERSMRVFGLQSGGSVGDVFEITAATNGEAFSLSRNSAEIVTAVQNALENTDNDITVELLPFGDFAGLVESVTPQIDGAIAGDPITNVNPGDLIKFDVVFTRGSFIGSTVQTFSFRFKVIAEDVATILEVPVTVVIN